MKLTPDFMLIPASAMSKPIPKGLYAARPGTGPEGETCGSCDWLVRKRTSRAYLKCGRMQALWTGGGGSDVKAKAPASSKWEAAK